MPARGAACSCGRGPSVAQGRWYGVRSYLHLFYEDCTRASPDGDGAESSSARPPGTWPSIIWKVSLSTGTLFLLAGAAALATGSLVPPKLEGIGEEDFVVLDLQAARYNRALGACRLLGLALCAAAGVLSAVGLLSCLLGRAGGAPRRPQEEEQQLSPILRDSPVAPAVPFGASRLHSVQPRREA
ncbi:neurensin-2 [Anser cygnoides]|uniref:Neurensin 2 n=1 Tax=Anser cygnoides TaxID=8845 RepID=A0A8B9IFE7_ANSCY|nr:neurensin-2-like [Anser cygnoides]